MTGSSDTLLAQSLCGSHFQAQASQSDCAGQCECASWGKQGKEGFTHRSSEVEAFMQGDRVLDRIEGADVPALRGKISRICKPVTQGNEKGTAVNGSNLRGPKSAKLGAPMTQK